MAMVTIEQARTDLPALIARAEAGEEIVIARDDKPAAKITAVEAPPQKRRIPGALKGKLAIPDEFFFDPLPEEELKAWEGGD